MDTNFIQARIQSVTLAARADAQGVERRAEGSIDAQNAQASSSAGLSRSADTARKLQGVFTTMLVKEMRRGLENGFFGEGSSGDIYSGWLDERVGQVMANRDALHMQRLLGSAFEQAEKNVESKGTEAQKP